MKKEEGRKGKREGGEREKERKEYLQQRALCTRNGELCVPATDNFVYLQQKALCTCNVQRALSTRNGEKKKETHCL